MSVRLLLLGALLLLAVAAGNGSHAGERPEVPSVGSLAGQLLVATPEMGDPRFAKTVIYMIDHNAEGAMGLVINRAYGEGPLKVFLGSIGMDNGNAEGKIRLQYGGPVEPGRGVVLHSAEYAGPSTRRIGDQVAVSFGRDVLEALAEGRGPRQRMVFLGYAGWGPGQLERELARDDWLTAPAEEALIFSDDLDGMWKRAFRMAGISL
jgi:putative transcriptional regulator